MRTNATEKDDIATRIALMKGQAAAGNDATNGSADASEAANGNVMAQGIAVAQQIVAGTMKQAMEAMAKIPEATATVVNGLAGSHPLGAIVNGPIGQAMGVPPVSQMLSQLLGAAARVKGG